MPQPPSPGGFQATAIGWALQRQREASDLERVRDDAELVAVTALQRCTADRLESLVPPNIVPFARESALVDPLPSASSLARSSTGRR